MGALRRLSTAIILLSITAILSSSSSAAASSDIESSELDSGRLDGLVDDFDDDDDVDEGLIGDEGLKRAAFRTDLGKRDDEDTRQIRDTRARSLSKSFKMDLGKRRGSSMFRNDLGRRSAWDRAASSSRVGDMGPPRRAMFRSDLGKRVPYSYSRRMFRTDLGKRQMFRHDLG